jgi:hypothetical protein
MQFIDAINSEVFVAEEYAPLFNSDTFAPAILLAFFLRAMQPPRPAPVERVFPQRVFITRPRKAKMSDTMLESLVVCFFKCNATVRV